MVGVWWHRLKLVVVVVVLLLRRVLGLVVPQLRRRTMVGMGLRLVMWRHCKLGSAKVGNNARVPRMRRWRLLSVRGSVAGSAAVFAPLSRHGDNSIQVGAAKIGQPVRQVGAIRDVD